MIDVAHISRLSRQHERTAIEIGEQFAVACGMRAAQIVPAVQVFEFDV
jgi:hypothetical protein